MPEGDTIFRAAATMHRALAGQVVTSFESVLPALNRIDADKSVRGRTIEAVSARGKHLLIAFSGDLTLRTHMRMNGSWHLYRPGERWQRPRRDMRIMIETDPIVAVGFNIPVAEFLNGAALARHPDLSTLGPDLLDPSFDEAEAIRRVRARPGDAVDDVLLNQRVLAGIGNVLKSETLFLAGVDPFRTIASLQEDTVRSIVRTAQALIAVTARSSSRNTTRRLHPDERLWVYGRRGQACRKCGSTVQAKKTGLDARLTYRCPICQG